MSPAARGGGAGRGVVRALVVAVTVAAFALRLKGLADWPPGLYHDEAFNGLDAVAVLHGRLAVWFPANNGREPLFIYLMAAAVRVLGRSPAAVRLPSAFLGTGAVAAAYALGSRLRRPRTGLFAAALLAVLPWSVLLGRVGFRAGALVPALLLAAAATHRAVTLAAVSPPKGARWAAFGGALAGLCLYTYTAARAMVLVPLLLGLWYLVATRSGEATRPAGIRRVVRRWLLTASLTIVPLAVAAARDPAGVLARAGQVAITNPSVNGGDPLGAAVANVKGVLGMFVVRGDFIPRHNIPLRPVFGPLAGAVFVLGVVSLLVEAGPRSDRRWAARGLILWLVAGLLPTLLAEGAPHFLRGVAVLPAAVIVAAWGAEAVAGGVLAVVRRRPWRHRLAVTVWIAAAVLSVTGELGATLGYAASTRRGTASPAAANLGYAFEAGATALAAQANAVRGAGWVSGWSATGSRSGTGAVWLDRRLRDGWAGVPFLVPEATVTLTDPYDPVLMSAGTAFLQPHGLDLTRVWAAVAPTLRIDITDGRLERGDLETHARRLFVRADGTPTSGGAGAARSAPLARFEDGLELVEARVMDAGPDEGSGLTPRGEVEGLGSGAVESASTVVETVWRKTRAGGPTPTLFVQLLDGGRLVATVDAVPGAGRDDDGEDLLPAALWPPGLEVVDRRVLPGKRGGASEVIAGLYVGPDARRLQVFTPGGTPLGDHVSLTGGPPRGRNP